MKVLHVVEATTAGVGRHVCDLAVQMRRAGLDVAVACPRVRETARRDTDFVGRLAAAGVPVVILSLRHGLHLLADVRDCARLARLIQGGGYDVVHTHSSKAGALGRLSAYGCRVPAVVYTPNAFAFLGARNRWQRWLYLSVERWLGHRCSDVVICVSPSEMMLARRESIAPPQRLVLTENAIDASHFAPTIDPAVAKADLGLDPHRLTVGYVGRLDRQKGIGFLIEAAQQVVRSEDTIQFVLVGEGELEGAMRRKVAACDLNGHVTLTGYRSDVPRLLAALDVFALPSLYEGLPYVLMEAMAAGRAVVATDVGGNRDLVRHGETGILVPPSDVQALAEALLGLLASPHERERLGQAARVAARSRPTPEQMAHQTIQVYVRVLEGKGNRG
jgi:glycosyltransferase involved in cell wall biosynthesis